MNKPDVKKLILLNLPYVFAFYFADKIAAVFRLAPGTEFIDKLTNGFAVFGTTFANPLPSFHPVDLLIGVIAGALLKLAVYVKGKNRKKFRQGEEYGSARWGKPPHVLSRMDHYHVGSHLADLGLDALLGALADGEHSDDGADTDNDAEHRQESSELVVAQCFQGYSE